MMSEDMITNIYVPKFLKNITEKKVFDDLPFHEGLELLFDCWRFFLLIHYPESKFVKNYSAQEKLNAFETYNYCRSMYNYFAPYFVQMVNGKRNEGIGFFKYFNGGIIIRSNCGNEFFLISFETTLDFGRNLIFFTSDGIK